MVILALLKQAVHLSSLGTQQLTDHLLMAHLEQKHSALSAIKPDSTTLGFWLTRSQQEVRFSCCLPFLPDHVMSQCTLGNPGLWNRTTTATLSGPHDWLAQSISCFYACALMEEGEGLRGNTMKTLLQSKPWVEQMEAPSFLCNPALVRLKIWLLCESLDVRWNKGPHERPGSKKGILCIGINKRSKQALLPNNAYCLALLRLIWCSHSNNVLTYMRGITLA